MSPHHDPPPPPHQRLIPLHTPPSSMKKAKKRFSQNGRGASGLGKWKLVVKKLGKWKLRGPFHSICKNLKLKYAILQYLHMNNLYLAGIFIGPAENFFLKTKYE